MHGLEGVERKGKWEYDEGKKENSEEEIRARSQMGTDDISTVYAAELRAIDLGLSIVETDRLRIVVFTDS
jgi:hypothetical protein